MSSRFTDPEIEKLSDLAGELPVPLLARRYNSWARSQGLPERTEKALHKYIWEAGMPIEPFGEFVRTGMIVECLQADLKIVERWVRKGWIQPVQQHRDDSKRRKAARRAFRRSDLRKMARQHPEAFAGCPRHGLFILLEDEKLTDDVRRLHPHKPRAHSHPRQVLCVDTNERFPSCSAAARAVGCSRWTIRRSIQSGVPVLGLRFAALQLRNPNVS
jgi:hypothetical protein